MTNLTIILATKCLASMPLISFSYQWNCLHSIIQLIWKKIKTWSEAGSIYAILTKMWTSTLFEHFKVIYSLAKVWLHGPVFWWNLHTIVLLAPFYKDCYTGSNFPLWLNWMVCTVYVLVLWNVQIMVWALKICKKLKHLFSLKIHPILAKKNSQ